MPVADLGWLPACTKRKKSNLRGRKHPDSLPPPAGSCSRKPQGQDLPFSRKNLLNGDEKHHFQQPGERSHTVEACEISGLPRHGGRRRRAISFLSAALRRQTAMCFRSHTGRLDGPRRLRGLQHGRGGSRTSFWFFSRKPGLEL